jgi:CubicO group peptidase (beta-lactamase class C family)
MHLMPKRGEADFMSHPPNTLPPSTASLAGSVAAGPAGSDPLPNQIPGVPIPAGRIDAAIKQLEAVIDTVRSESNVPAMAVAVVQAGGTLYERAVGARALGSNTGAVDLDTVFQLASLSKPIAATLVAREVSLGKVSWDTTVKSQLPWFALADPYVTKNLTVGDCFAHRSGLGDQSGDVIEDIGWNRREVLERLEYLPLDDFRVRHHYTNWGFTAGAEAVAAAAGMSWEDLIAQQLYAPLGMKSASSRYADYIGNSNRASGHAWVEGRFQPWFVRQPDPQSPAGGVSASVRDLIPWMQLVLSGGQRPKDFISPAAMMATLTPQSLTGPPSTPDSRSGFYGYGIGVNVQSSGRVQYSHSGAFCLGAGTNVMFLPSADIAIVTLTNAAPVGAAEAVSAEFMDLVQYGKPSRNWYDFYHQHMKPLLAPVGSLVGKSRPAQPEPPRPDAGYLGSYHNDCFGTIDIVKSGEDLVLRMGPDKKPFPLETWSGDEFVFPVICESAPFGSGSFVRFGEPSEAGTSPSVVIELLDADGLGTFFRQP